MSPPASVSLEKLSISELRDRVGGLVLALDQLRAEHAALQDRAEAQQARLAALQVENQALRDEVARLQGLPPRPPLRSMAPRRTASFQKLLLPSISTSPEESRPESVTSASSVAAPAGSMIQTARGGASAATSAGRSATACAPSAPSASRAAASRSKATQ